MCFLFNPVLELWGNPVKTKHYPLEIDSWKMMNVLLKWSLFFRDMLIVIFEGDTTNTYTSYIHQS